MFVSLAAVVLMIARPTDLQATPDALARQSAVESGESPVPLYRLWLGLALAPGMWVLGELAGYYLAARSCDAAHGVPLTGTVHPALTHVVFESIMAIIAIVGLAISAGNWKLARRDTGPGDSPAPGRAHFMAFTGIIVSAVFLFGIVLFGFSGFVVDVCNQAR